MVICFQLVVPLIQRPNFTFSAPSSPVGWAGVISINLILAPPFEGSNTLEIMYVRREIGSIVDSAPALNLRHFFPFRHAFLSTLSTFFHSTPKGVIGICNQCLVFQLISVRKTIPQLNMVLVFLPLISISDLQIAYDSLGFNSCPNNSNYALGFSSCRRSLSNDNTVHAEAVFHNAFFVRESLSSTNNSSPSGEFTPTRGRMPPVAPQS